MQMADEVDDLEDRSVVLDDDGGCSHDNVVAGGSGRQRFGS